MSVARIGEIGLLAVDCEMLVEPGKAIKASSPFKHTFIVTNCSGGFGYLPPAHAYPEGGYEVNLTGFAGGSGRPRRQARRPDARIRA